MRRVFITLLTIFLFAGSALAQKADVAQPSEGKFPFSIKAYPFRGTYLDGGVHWEKFGRAYPAGVNLGFELPSNQQYPWQ